MRTATPLFVLASAATAFASISPAPIPKGANPVSLPANFTLDKRNFCFLGFCIGGTDYSNDVNNCGSAGHKCSTSWAGGGGAQCVSGVCMPSYCNNLWDLDPLSGQCRDVSSDVSNWCASLPSFVLRLVKADDSRNDTAASVDRRVTLRTPRRRPASPASATQRRANPATLFPPAPATRTSTRPAMSVLSCLYTLSFSLTCTSPGQQLRRHRQQMPEFFRPRHRLDLHSGRLPAGFVQYRLRV